MPKPWKRAARAQRTAWDAFSLALLVFALGCATPVGIRRVSLSEVDRILGENAITGDAPSALSRQILARLGLSTLYEDDPRTSLEKLPQLEIVDAITGERLAAAIDDRLVAAPGEQAGDRLPGDAVSWRDVEAFLDSRARRLAARLSALHQLSAPEAAPVPNDGLGGDGASPARVGLRP